VRRTGVIVLTLVALALMGSTAVLYSKYRKSSDAYDQLSSDETNTRIRYSQAIGEIATIQDSLDTIVLGETPLQSGTSTSEMNLPPTSKEQVLQRIATLRAGLERTKERIEDLDARLKHEGVRIAGLQKMIGGLKKTAAEKEIEIAGLTAQVDSLHTQVATLNTDVETKQQTIDTQTQQITDKQHELATIYYTIGKKKDLMHNGVVVAEGGVLGMGKTLKPSGQVNESSFTPLDTDQETVIQIPAGKAQILSQQAPASYTLTSTGKESMELRITDPKEFRKVRHLVILLT